MSLTPISNIIEERGIGSKIGQNCGQPSRMIVCIYTDFIVKDRSHMHTVTVRVRKTVRVRVRVTSRTIPFAQLRWTNNSKVKLT